MSPVSRILNIFISPSETFTDLKRNSSWWLAWLLVSISSLFLAFAVQQKIGFQQVWENALHTVPKQEARINQMPADQQQKTRQASGKITMIRAYAAPLFGLLISMIVAGVLMGVFNFGVGTEVPFSLSLAIVFYAGLPVVLKNVIAAVLILAGFISEGFLLDNPLGTNLGFFLDPTKSFFLYSIGASLDIFAIWTLILTAIGFHSVSKVRLSTALSLIMGVYFSFVLLVTGVFSLLL